MTNGTKKYWLYIDSYVHISIRGGRVLLYNSYNGQILEYDDREIINLVRRLLVSRNLRVIGLSRGQLQHPLIASFAEDLRRSFMGDLIDRNDSMGKPIQMPPIVKIQKDVKYLKGEKVRSVGEDLVSYLSELSIYLNDDCNQGCSVCPNAYKQFLCCTVGKSKQKGLPVEQVIGFLNRMKGSSLSRLNLLGGDPFAYHGLEDLAAVLKQLRIPEMIIYAHYRNLAQSTVAPRIMESLKSLGIRFRIPVTFPIHKPSLARALDLTGEMGKMLFIIQDEAQFNEAEQLCELYSLEEPLFQPLYNGKNLELFEQNIYIEREDIMEARPGMREIYSRQAVNPLDFGRLTILSNGSVYANVNASRLGKLGKDSGYDILFKEMERGKSWRRLRSRVAPCKGCNYQLLCPPLSNYNYALGKADLCTIHRPVEV